MPVLTRAKLLVSQRGRTVAIVLAVVGTLALAGAAQAYVTPQTVTETRTVDEQTVTLTANTSAEVVRDTALYDRGQRLRDRSTYLINATPTIRLRVDTNATGGRFERITQRVRVRYVATRDGQAFYTETVGSRAVQAAGNASTTLTLDLTRIREDLATRQEEIGAAGQVGAVLLVNASYATGQYEDRIGLRTPMVVTEEAVWFGAATGARNRHARTVIQRRQRPPDPTRYGGLAAIGVLALLGAVGTVSVREEIDVEALRTQLAHARNGEWISEGEFPTDVGEKDYITINSLADLVDIAIDTNNRVIHDPDIEAYAVIVGSEVYYFSVDALSTDPWLDL